MNEKILLTDFIEIAIAQGCLLIKSRKESFVGNGRDATNYPHLHVWENGKIALSVGVGRNMTVGRDGEIDVLLLKDAALRFEIPGGELKDAIDLVPDNTEYL